MNKEKYIDDLVHRMANLVDRNKLFFKGKKYGNPNKTPYKADEEAHLLRDIDYFPILKKRIAELTNEDVKSEAYRALRYLYQNSNKDEILAYLLAQVRSEKEDWTKYRILSCIEHMNQPVPMGFDITIILELTNFRRTLIRDAAIKALGNVPHPEAVDNLIHIIKTSSNPDQLSHTNQSLYKIGTFKAIPFLKKLLNHSKEDVVASAFYAIENIAQEKELDLYRNKLSKGRIKWCAIDAVLKFGDISDIPLMEQRIKELLRRERKTGVVNEQDETELILALKFLKRFESECDNYLKMMSWILDKKKNLLWDSEINWINKTTTNNVYNP